MSIHQIVGAFDKFTEWVGKCVSFLFLPLIAIIVYSVISRYVFNHAPMWSDEMASFCWGTAWAMGGASTYLIGGHVRMDTFYARLSPKSTAIANLITMPFFYIFVGVMLWNTSEFAWYSIRIQEHSSTLWSPPVYPAKAFIPLSVFLLLLQGLARSIDDIIMLRRKNNYG